MAECGSSSKTVSVTNVPALAADNTMYQQRLGIALTPLMASNQRLSTAMNVLDGSRSSNNAIKVTLKNAQASLTSTQGAIGTVTVPIGAKTLSQRTGQALTQEDGYLPATGECHVRQSVERQRRSGPAVRCESDQRSDPAECCRPQRSEQGVRNWSQGAAAVAKKKNTPPSVVVVPPTTTNIVSPPTPTLHLRPI